MPAGLRNKAPSDPSKLPGELRVLLLDDRGYVFLVAPVRPEGLPRLLEARLEVASRLVLAYLRVLDFPLGLRDLTLAFSVISGIIA